MTDRERQAGARLTSPRRAGWRVSALLLVIMTALSPAPAAAQSSLRDLSLEDLMATQVDQVYGASKFLQKVTDAPATVTIVSADEIKLYGYRTLADVLRSVEGISTSYDRNYTYLGIRGLSRPGDYNNRLLVLLDSVKGDDDARQEFVDLLELLGPDDPRTGTYRRQLTSRLF